MTPTQAAALMRRAAHRSDELVATYFPNPSVVQDVFDLSAELKAAATELEHTDALDPVNTTTNTDPKSVSLTDVKPCW